jgi:hypothetical protein
MQASDMNGCAVRRVLWAPRPAELGDLREVSTPRTVDPLKRRFGVRGSVAVRRLANPVTLCDGHGVFFVAASGQIRMAANRRRQGVEHCSELRQRPAQFL